MEKEKTPVERLHDDIRRAIEKIEDDVMILCVSIVTRMMMQAK